MTATKFLNSAKVGQVFTWPEIAVVHPVRNGIYHRHERIVSLLTDFGRINPCYPDFHGDSTDVIHYTGSGRHGDQKLDPANRALFNAITSRHGVPLFNKLAVGKWEFTGLWRVTDGQYIFDEKQNRMLWQFTLTRAEE